MLPLDTLFFLLFVLLVALQSLFNPIPIGNGNSTVRRLPLITFAIIIINVLAFLASLPVLGRQEEELGRKHVEIMEFVTDHPTLLFNKEARQKLIDGHVASAEDFAGYDAVTRGTQGIDTVYSELIGEARTAELMAELDVKIAIFKKAYEKNLYYEYGIAPNGEWKPYQLISHMFMHGGWLHLLGNMLCFFAVGFSLEDLWGRGVFTGFYLLAGVAACMPQIISPETMPSIGASGAISAAMGAFLIRLPKEKIKIFWLFIPFSFFLLLRLALSGRKPWGVIHVAAYIFMPYYLLTQLLSWWFYSKSGQVSGIAFSVHVAGFAFGALFALALKASKVEEKYIHPRIEGKISFDAAPIVNESLALIDQGDVVTAERKLHAHLAASPQDLNALMALIQLYQKTENYEQLNNLYARLIRYYLAQGDKEGALYAYDGLLSSFPEDAVNPKIFIRDWMALCEYLKELGMPREASVEYERLVKTCADDPLVVRACIQGGEAALQANDKERALRLFERAMSLNPSGALQMRIARGLDYCRGNAGVAFQQPPA